MLLGSIRGIHICVPRNMTQAAGFYNTLLKGEEPALVIEPLKGYYVREKLPENIGEYCIPLGIPEILLEGTDLTLVTYGWNATIAMEASAILKTMGISVELIDVQTLSPFDTGHLITQSLLKTNHLVLLDEDVPEVEPAICSRRSLSRKKPSTLWMRNRWSFQPKTIAEPMAPTASIF